MCTKATHRSLSVSYSTTRAKCGAYRSVLCPESCRGGMVRRTAGRRWARGASLSAFWQLRLTRPLSHPIDTDRTTVYQWWRVRGYVNTDAVRHVAVGVRAPTPPLVLPPRRPLARHATPRVRTPSPPPPPPPPHTHFYSITITRQMRTSNHCWPSIYRKTFLYWHAHFAHFARVFLMKERLSK